MSETDSTKKPLPSCSHCNRSELKPSRTKGSEKLIRFALPMRPFRCQSCYERHWLYDGYSWGSALFAASIISAIALLAAAALA